jgi:transcriptional regulator with XRE-family HTH domain
MAGWDATGLLEKHWGKVGGRDKLAAKTGIQGPTLSAYNTGRQKLGMRNAKKIARALKVTIFDLGAPTEAQVADGSVSLVDRVAALEAAVAQLQGESAAPRRPEGGEA